METYDASPPKQFNAVNTNNIKTASFHQNTIHKNTTQGSSEQLTLSHVEVKESEFVTFFDKYLAKLDDKQRNSFADSRDTLKNMKRGYE
jgi:hypothetical protein